MSCRQYLTSQKFPCSLRYKSYDWLGMAMAKTIYEHVKRYSRSSPKAKTRGKTKKMLGGTKIVYQCMNWKIGIWH